MAGGPQSRIDEAGDAFWNDCYDKVMSKLSDE